MSRQAGVPGFSICVLTESSFQCVIVSGISLISNAFVRAHHLSSETKGAVLGLERIRQEDATQQQQQPGTPPQGRSIELSPVREDGLRLRS